MTRFTSKLEIVFPKGYDEDAIGAVEDLLLEELDDNIGDVDESSVGKITLVVHDLASGLIAVRRLLRSRTSLPSTLRLVGDTSFETTLGSEEIPVL